MTENRQNYFVQNDLSLKNLMIAQNKTWCFECLDHF